MSPDLDALIRAHLAHLRELEAAAAADPGMEASHDHDETPAFTAYDHLYRSLPKWIGGLPRPDGWLAWHRLVQELGPEAGDVVYPGVHKSPMDWDSRGLSLLTPLLESLLEAAADPTGFETLSAPEVLELLADPVWWDSPWARARGTSPAGVRNTPAWTALRAAIVERAGLPPAGPWRGDDPLLLELPLRAHPRGLFDVTRFSLEPPGGSGRDGRLVLHYTVQPVAERSVSIALSLQEPGTGMPVEGGVLYLTLEARSTVPLVWREDQRWVAAKGGRVQVDAARIVWKPPRGLLERCPRPLLHVGFPFLLLAYRRVNAGTDYLVELS